MTVETRHSGRNASRIVLADDDTLLREGIASLLRESGFDVVGQAQDAAGLLGLVREHRPDLAIIDVPDAAQLSHRGLDAALQIRKELPETGILVLSTPGVGEAMELLAAGQRVGYLLKSRVTDVDEFAKPSVGSRPGAPVVDPALVRELIAARRRDHFLEHLTAREPGGVTRSWLRAVRTAVASRTSSGLLRGQWKARPASLLRMRLPGLEEDHRRVLAVLAYLELQ